MEAIEIPKTVIPQRKMTSKVSHPPYFGTRLHLPPSGWGKARHCRRQVWTGPGRLYCLAEVVACSTGHQSRRGTWTRSHSQLWLPDPRVGVSDHAVGGWLTHPEASTHGPTWGGSAGRMGCPHPFSQTGDSLLDTPTASAVFQEKADAIAELADGGWYHPGSSTGSACCFQGPVQPAREPRAWPGSRYPPCAIVPAGPLALPLLLSSPAPPSGPNITSCPNPASLQFPRRQP